MDYTAQNGDSLLSLASHFNTTVQEILDANPVIPADATTLPPGLPMQIPIYYRDFWGSPYQIIPDSHFINGPAVIGFDTEEFVSSWDGWLKDYVEYAAGETRSGAEIINYIARDYSISPRVLLAVADQLGGALSDPALPEDSLTYPLGYRIKDCIGSSSGWLTVSITGITAGAMGIWLNLNCMTAPSNVPTRGRMLLR
jgi:hypothetical protein